MMWLLYQIKNRCNKKSSGVGGFPKPKEIAVTLGKSQMIVIQKNTKKNNWEELELNGKRMEIVEEYKYLEEVINNKGTDKNPI